MVKTIAGRSLDARCSRRGCPRLIGEQQHGSKSKHERSNATYSSWIVLTLMTVSGGSGGDRAAVLPALTTTAIDQGQCARRQAVRSGTSRGARHLRPRGCYNCHSQMIRPFCAETERYGHYSVAGEVHLRPPVPVGLQTHRPGPRPRRWPLLRRWQRVHLLNPATSCPESNMPAFPWAPIARSGRRTSRTACARSTRSVCRTATEIAAAPGALEGKTELDAVVAYLQGLGTAISHLGKSTRAVDINDFRSLITVLIALRRFLGICAWAYRAGEGRFRRGGASALSDDDLPAPRGRQRPTRENKWLTFISGFWNMYVMVLVALHPVLCSCWRRT